MVTVRGGMEGRRRRCVSSTEQPSTTRPAASYTEHMSRIDAVAFSVGVPWLLTTPRRRTGSTATAYGQAPTRTSATCVSVSRSTTLTAFANGTAANRRRFGSPPHSPHGMPFPANLTTLSAAAFGILTHEVKRLSAKSGERLSRLLPPACFAVFCLPSSVYYLLPTDRVGTLSALCRRNGPRSGICVRSSN